MIFPNVAAPLLRQHQAELLQKHLLLYFQQAGKQDFTLLCQGSDFHKLLLWSLTLGAIAASPTSETRGWFAAQVFTQVATRELIWDQFYDEMNTFLFWDCVMAGPMEKLCFDEGIF